MTYTVNIEHFAGPLDLLLQLVEKNELEISKISLAGATQQFVVYMQSGQVPPEEIADFLVVAAKLIYIKSRLLMPDFSDSLMEEGPDLEAQLRQYQLFANAARAIDKDWAEGCRSYARRQVSIRRREAEFLPPQNANVEVLSDVMQRLIARLEPILRLPKAAVKRAISLHERINDLFLKVRKHAKFTFKQFLAGAKHKEEAIVGFLALLELVKQRFVAVDQKDLFLDIAITMHPEAPSQDPLAESFT